jgi:hypothetical protein
MILSASIRRCGRRPRSPLGVTSRPWEIDDIVDVLEVWETSGGMSIANKCDVSFNGNHPMPGMVEAFDDESLTVVFNQPSTRNQS